MTEVQRGLFWGSLFGVILGAVEAFVFLTASTGSGESTIAAKEDGQPAGTLDAPLKGRIYVLRSEPLFLHEVGRVEKQFHRLLALHRRAAANPLNLCWAPIPKFSVEAYYRFREARLLALGFPDVAERLASEVAEDSDAQKDDRLYALVVLEALAKVGRTKAERTLVKICRDEDPAIASLALARLADVDSLGRYRGLFLEKALEDDPEALRALPLWPAVEGLEVLRKAARRPESGLCSWGSNPWLAQEGAAQMELACASDWQRRLVEIVARDSLQTESWLLWALRLAQIRPVPGLAEVLRQRLSLAESHEPPGYTSVSSNDAPLMVSAKADPHFDGILLAYAEMGGDLNELEEQRLRFFGYACDPRQRLAELLGAGK